MGNTIEIDLGTTNSCVCVVEGGRPSGSGQQRQNDQFCQAVYSP